ncbi:MAG: zinc metalloprotease HtpX, partial [Alphaproteobacteria bacterium]|nr:zinc metalloprotease HtpX [Alphaproteobacteria bacterium]
MDASPRIDPQQQRSHRRRNAVHSALLLGAMLVLLGLCGWIVGGVPGLIWLGFIGVAGLGAAMRVSPGMVLRLFRAVPLSRADLPEVYDITVELARRAGLRRVPPLYFISSPTMNAFTVGGEADGAVAVTGGLLRALDLRQLAGVLAHEICHLRSGDTRVMSFAGLLLLLFNLPLMATGGGTVSWLLVLLLVFAPTLVGLLQLALSRTREFEADVSAVALTDDPDGMASALQRLEDYQAGFWEDILLPGRRVPIPSVLRSHPTSAERIERLLKLRRQPRPRPITLAHDLHRHHGSVPT